MADHVDEEQDTADNTEEEVIEQHDLSELRRKNQERIRRGKTSSKPERRWISTLQSHI